VAEEQPSAATRLDRALAHPGQLVAGEQIEDLLRGTIGDQLRPIAPEIDPDGGRTRPSPR
jgi:hypothetical protein